MRCRHSECPSRPQNPTPTDCPTGYINLSVRSPCGHRSQVVVIEGACGVDEIVNNRWIRVEKFLGVFFLMAQIEVVSQCVWHRDRRVILALEIYHNTYFDCDCLHSHKKLCGTLTYINHIILINREAYLPFDPVGAADQDMPSIEIRVNQS
ncbi:hypothetical protein CAPTEDRAFT_216442 [Capitella teleta]|uniref:Uncharacterized protein n=1 Tax=Capitella teleta TaxID=283909 RepID=R7TK58_CAPTE|nr:hypothetical protein CAPTEDRAFT_216442 [Capitella teleta]|eukprot:ELT91916.1 hypothetical protein CAPTEDRAFT_216442 [Capitella teleta]